jgi:hypothetical protein
MPPQVTQDTTLESIPPINIYTISIRDLILSLERAKSDLKGGKHYSSVPVSIFVTDNASMKEFKLNKSQGLFNILRYNKSTL